MKKLGFLIVVGAVLYLDWIDNGRTPRSAVLVDSTRLEQDKDGSAAIPMQVSGSQISGVGRVLQLLPDDQEGKRHQRFILALPSGQTLLVAHNIDLAPRLASAKVGDTVEFSGVYEWNAKGGVVHWTHRDPAGRHGGGWLRHAGRVYQ